MRMAALGQGVVSIALKELLKDSTAVMRFSLYNGPVEYCCVGGDRVSDAMLSAVTPPLHCTSILQPATLSQVVAFESCTICAPLCLNNFIRA